MNVIILLYYLYNIHIIKHNLFWYTYVYSIYNNYKYICVNNEKISIIYNINRLLEEFLKVSNM